MTDEINVARGPDDTAHLSSREQATYRELSRVDPQLASLFSFGHEMLRRQPDSSTAYVVAHVGRELSRGVINALTGTEDALSADRDDDAESCDKNRRERNRKRIATAIELPESHGTVATWFDSVGVLAAHAHFAAKVRRLEHVRAAFSRLSELLHGRFAPFFDASAELSRLSGIDQPTEHDADAATRLLVRPQLRRQFFSSTTSPAWIPLLANRRHFDSPPERLIEDDQSWRMQAWPEGDYLARMVAVAPTGAVAQLLQVPGTNTNPLVWGALVDAALNADDPLRGDLARRVARALRGLPPVYLPHKAADLLVHIAARLGDGSFELFAALLWMRGETDRVAHLERSREYRRLLPTSGRATEWVLARIEVYDLQRMVNQALPALLTIDPFRALRIVSDALHKALLLLREENTTEADWEYSHIHCPILETACDQEDVRAVLSGATVRAAMAAAGQSDDDAKRVVELLSRRAGALWQRLTWHVIANVSAQMRDAAESLIAGSALLEPPFGLREVGQLLRSCFAGVSQHARADFARALAAGPPAEDLADRVQFEKRWRANTTQFEPHITSEQESDAQRADSIKKVWQLRRLRLFHDALPVELAELAATLSYTPSLPSFEEQAADEGRMISTGSGSGGAPVSPKSVDEMMQMGTRELLAFLDTSKVAATPDVRTDVHWALNQELSRFAARDVARAVSLLECGREHLDLTHVAMLVQGLRDACKESRLVNWADLMPELVAQLERTVGATDDAEEASGCERLSVDLVALVITACNADSIPHDQSEFVHAFAQSAIASRLTRCGLIPESEHPNAVVSNALTRISGDLVRLVVSAGSWDYRARRGDDGAGAGPRTGVEPEVERWVERLLSELLAASAREDDAISISIALQIDRIHLLAPDWVERSQERLFGSSGKVINPCARALVQAPNAWGSSIEAKRWILVQLTQALAENQQDGDSDDSLGASLLRRVVQGFLWGVWQRGESDRVVEAAFEVTTPKDRAGIYWPIFRGLSDTREPDADFAARAVDLWRWRVEVLATSADVSARAIEGEGLLWLLKSPHLDPLATVDLGLRTVRLGPFADPIATASWERVSTLMRAVPREAFELLAELLDVQVQMLHSYVPYELVSPALRVALKNDDPEIRARAERAIHQLGVKGHMEFGQLLLESN